jgi:hypothetical protein
VVWADRGHPDVVAAGDQACLSFAPGLLRFLEGDLGGGLKAGVGFAPRWILPLTAAASACYYLASPRGRENLNTWTATRVRLGWRRACDDGETAEACARITRVGRASIRFAWRVESAERRDLMAEGELILVSRGPEGTRPPVLRLHPPRDEAPSAPPAAPSPPPSRRRWPSRVRGLAGRLRRYRARLLASPALAASHPREAPEGGSPRAAAGDPAPAEIYYVCDEAPGAAGAAREPFTTARDLLERAALLFTNGRSDDLLTPPAPAAGASLAARTAAFAARLAACAGPGVRVLRACGGPDREAHLACVRALHPQVRVATATEAALAFVDCYATEPVAAALPATHCRGDGLHWRHPVRILGRAVPLAPGPSPRVRLPASWWEPGDVRELAVAREGAVVARREVARDEPPAIEFPAEAHGGYELHVELHPRALRRCPARVPAWPAAAGRPSGEGGGRFLEWPRGPDELLACFEAPFLLHAGQARQGPAAPGDSWSWVYPPGLLRLLYSPIAGAAEPLGRRAHPLGSIAAAATVHAALESLAGSWAPWTLTIRWRHTVDPRAGLLVHLRVCRCDTAEVDLSSRLEQPPAVLADVSLTLRAAGPGGGA